MSFSCVLLTVDGTFMITRVKAKFMYNSFFFKERGFPLPHFIDEAGKQPNQQDQHLLPTRRKHQIQAKHSGNVWNKPKNDSQTAAYSNSNPWAKHQCIFLLQHQIQEKKRSHAQIHAIRMSSPRCLYNRRMNRRRESACASSQRTNHCCRVPFSLARS